MVMIANLVFVCIPRYKYMSIYFCWKMFAPVFFTCSSSMLPKSFRSKWHLQRASQQSKTSGFTQLSLDIKPLPTTNVKLSTQGSLIEIPWHRVMVHTNLYTFNANNPTFVWLEVEFRNHTNTHLIPRHQNLSRLAHLIETPQWPVDLMFVALWYDKNDPYESTWVLMQQEIGFLDSCWTKLRGLELLWGEIRCTSIEVKIGAFLKFTPRCWIVVTFAQNIMSKHLSISVELPSLPTKIWDSGCSSCRSHARPKDTWTDITKGNISSPFIAWQDLVSFVSLVWFVCLLRALSSWMASQKKENNKHQRRVPL